MSCGVYAVYGPSGVYVGVSINCERRNDQLTRLGISWMILEELPVTVTKSTRWCAETRWADILEARGERVVSRNTSGAQHAMGRGQKKGPMSPQHREKLLTALHKPEYRAKQSAAQKRIVAQRRRKGGKFV